MYIEVGVTLAEDGTDDSFETLSEVGFFFLMMCYLCQQPVLKTECFVIWLSDPRLCFNFFLVSLG